MNPTDSRYFLNHCGKPVLKGGATPDGYQEPLRCIRPGVPVYEVDGGKLVPTGEWLAIRGGKIIVTPEGRGE